MKWWDRMPWSSFSECWALSPLFHSFIFHNFHFHQEAFEFLFTFCCKGGVICISEVIWLNEICSFPRFCHWLLGVGQSASPYEPHLWNGLLSAVRRLSWGNACSIAHTSSTFSKRSQLLLCLSEGPEGLEAPRKSALRERFESIKFWNYIHVDSFLVLAKNEWPKMLSSSWLFLFI